MTHADSTIAPRIYTIAQLADILQVSPATVRANTKKGAWPYLRVSPKLIRFTEVHLATILAASEAPPPPPLTRLRRRRGEPPRYAPTAP